jgi:hypothetical protein
MEPSGGDEKWKLSKKGRSRSGRSRTVEAAAGQGSSTVLSRSYSASVSSTRQQQAGGTTTSQSQSSSTAAGGGGLSKKCVEAVKEHRARFYIVRRCVSMLVCWRDH